MMRNRDGFTLVELLIVIAVVGVLAGTTLTSLRGAKSKAIDIKIVSSVKQIRDIIESNYSGVGYPDLTNSSPIYGGFVAENNPGTTTLNILIANIFSQGGSVNVVNESGTTVLSYAIYGQLFSESTKYFCIDSSGRTNQEATTNTGTTCP